MPEAAPSPEVETKGGPTTMADVKLVSELKEIGWSVNGETGSWTAFEKAGELRKVGPAKTIKALHTQVKLAAGQPEPKGNGKTHKVGSSKLEGGEFVEKPGAQRLPTMEEPEIDELNQLADNCIKLKETRDKLKAAFADECDIMRQKMREYGRKRYNRKGMSLVIEDSEKLVIKKAKNTAAKPRTGRKAA